MAIYNTSITAISGVDPAELIASGSGNRAITTVIVCNHTSGDLTLDLHACAGGAGGSNSNIIVSSLVIPAKDTVTFDQEKMVLDTLDELRASASAVGLTATVSTLPV